MKRLALIVTLALVLVGNAGATAWSDYYRVGQVYPADSPRGYGLVDLKRELSYRNYGLNLRLTPSFGASMRNRVVEFQRAQGLATDGVVGPQTARRLFALRARRVEEARDIPSCLIRRQKTLESADDPGATGWADIRDRGLEQISGRWHPEVTDAQAFRAGFSLPWTGDRLVEAHSSTHDWDGAIAAHNIGLFYARLWSEAGKPASLKNDNGFDYGATATNYVRLVMAQPC